MIHDDYETFGAMEKKIEGCWGRHDRENSDVDFTELACSRLCSVGEFRIPRSVSPYHFIGTSGNVGEEPEAPELNPS